MMWTLMKAGSNCLATQHPCQHTEAGVRDIAGKKMGTPAGAKKTACITRIALLAHIWGMALRVSVSVPLLYAVMKCANCRISLTLNRSKEQVYLYFGNFIGTDTLLAHIWGMALRVSVSVPLLYAVMKCANYRISLTLNRSKDQVYLYFGNFIGTDTPSLIYRTAYLRQWRISFPYVNYLSYSITTLNKYVPGFLISSAKENFVTVGLLK
jgi:hypothetical protein